MRRITGSGPAAPSVEPAMKIASIKRLSTQKIENPLSDSEENIPTIESKMSPKESFVSLRTALEQTGRPKGADLDSRHILASENVERARDRPKSRSQKVKKSEALPKSSIEEATASDLEIMRKLNPTTQYQC